MNLCGLLVSLYYGEREDYLFTTKIASVTAAMKTVDLEATTQLPQHHSMT
jgi:hypothetical protein